MLFRTLKNEYFNLIHYKRFHVRTSPHFPGFFVSAELPTALPTEEEFYDDDLFFTESKDDALLFLQEIIKRMALGETCYSAQKILKELGIKED